MKRKIKVLALTGIRSEYDLLYPLLDAMRHDPAFSVRVVACGAHLTALHGRSIRAIEADGFRIAARIRNLSGEDGTAGRVRAAGRLLAALPAVLERGAPDLLLVLGDREEAFMGAIAAGYMDVPVVHIAGGDDTRPLHGDVDEQVRHATSKIAHVHLTMAEPHSRRLLRLGEEAWRVHTVGSPGLDRLRLEPPLPPPLSEPYVVSIYHALSSAVSEAGREAALCLDAALETGLVVYAGAPNSDPGYRSVLAEIRRRSGHPRLRAYRNLPRPEFTALLRGARALIGNSSLSLHEGAYLGLPCVNVGERQRGRLAGPNVQFTKAEPAAVRRALRRALFDEAYRARVRRAKPLYGDGRMVERALRILKNLPARRRLLAKAITY